MSLWNVLPAVIGLFGRSKAPRPPDWQARIGQQMAQLYEQFGPTVASRFASLSVPNANSLYMQILRKQIAQQAQLGQRALNYQLGRRGLLSPNLLAGAQAAYQAYANAFANQALQQGLLTEEQLARQALGQLANFISGQGAGAGQLGTAVAQQLMGQYQLQTAQEESLVQMLGLLLANLFRKKTAPAQTTAVTAPGASVIPSAPYTLGAVPNTASLFPPGIYTLNVR